MSYQKAVSISLGVIGLAFGLFSWAVEQNAAGNELGGTIDPSVQGVSHEEYKAQIQVKIGEWDRKLTALKKSMKVAEGPRKEELRVFIREVEPRLLHVQQEASKLPMISPIPSSNAVRQEIDQELALLEVRFKRFNYAD